MRNFLQAILGFGALSLLKGHISHNPDDVHFYLYPDPARPNYTQEIVYQNVSSLQSSSFQSGQKTVFVIHGFRNSYLMDMAQTVKNAYLKSDLGYNYILVDWYKLATPEPPLLTAALYALAVDNVPIVAVRVANFTLWLKSLGYLNLEGVHVVGHSLGSQVGGLTGENIQKQSGGDKPGRITGLDPAGPLFDPPIMARRLSKGDGTFVDAIHTNMGDLGDTMIDGDADFYANGGIHQPECAYNDTGIPNLTYPGTCSHRFAYILYAASFTKYLKGCTCTPFINLQQPFAFLGIPPYCGEPTAGSCPNEIRMGVFCPTSASGQFYVKTTNPP